MNKLNKTFWLLYFLLFSTLAFAQKLPETKPEKVGVSSARLTYLDKTFQAYVDDQYMSGAVIMALREGKTFYHKAFGYRDLESKSPMARDTIFRIASQSKAIVSVATMVLQERGMLDISEPVSKYIPEFKQTTVAVKQEDGKVTVEKAKRSITIHDLLTHTSGVAYGMGIAADAWKKAGIQGWYFANRQEPILKTVKRMAALPFESQPGEKWVYGYNTDILGAVLEVAAGKPLDTLLNELIIQPLKMVDTHFYLPTSKTHRLATVYSPSDLTTGEGKVKRAPEEGTMNAQGAYIDGPRQSYSGGAGLLSTAEDYAKFLQMLLNGGKLDKVRILSRKSVDLMLADHVGELFTRKGSGFGLGFRIVTDYAGNGRLSSPGVFRWGGAYHSTYWGDPKERLVVVYFTQLRPRTKIDDHKKLQTLIYQALID